MKQWARALGIVVLGFGATYADDLAERSKIRPGESEPLYRDDWTSWIVGDWAGVVRTEEGEGWIRQSFELAVDGRYVLTRMHRRDPGGPEYKGVGIFAYRPAEKRAYALWTGSANDINDGTAVRDGERMVWTIERFGRKSTRTRERISRDEFVVTTVTEHPDGTRSHIREELVRIH